MKKIIYYIVINIALWPLLGSAQEAGDAVFDLSRRLPPIEPEVNRREIAIPKIDSELVEFGAYVGALSAEDFGAGLLYGSRANLRVSEQFFFEGVWGRADVNDETFRRIGVNPFGSDSHQNMDYLVGLVGWDLFPGEMYISKARTLSASVYLLAGAGNIRLIGEEYFTGAAGLGIRMMPVDWISIRIEALGFEYQSSLLGYRKFSHNFASSIGLNFFF